MSRFFGLTKAKQREREGGHYFSGTVAGIFLIFGIVIVVMILLMYAFIQ